MSSKSTVDAAERAVDLLDRHRPSVPIGQLSDEEFELLKERGAAVADDTVEFGRVPDIVELGNLASERVQWLWRPYLPLGKLVILSGDPGVGKTWLGLAMCAMAASLQVV